MEASKLAKYLDFANHSPRSTQKQIQELCQGVLKYGFNAAFVNPCWVRLAKTYLRHLRGVPQAQHHLGGGIVWKPKVGTVINFPLGQDTTEMKIMAVRQVIKKGADEVDVSTNIGFLKSGKEKIYLKELKRIVQAAKKLRPATMIKFIIEAPLLTDKEIAKASLLVVKSGADFVKSSSGYGPLDATLKMVKIIKRTVGDKILIKAAGGIATRKQALDFIKAGASRLGTSKAVEIVTEK
jgi:deoxyribose-phosphate aldolase